MEKPKKEKDILKDKIKMITAVTEALNFKKIDNNPEKILKHITQFVKAEKDKEAKMAMIAAASKAVSISEKYNFLTEKEIIKRIMPELKEILEKID